jgi:acetate kinase
MGIKIDDARNDAHAGGREGVISTDDSRAAVYVVPTDEELLIARDAVRVISGAPQRY